VRLARELMLVKQVVEQLGCRVRADQL